MANRIIILYWKWVFVNMWRCKIFRLKITISKQVPEFYFYRKILLFLSNNLINFSIKDFNLQTVTENMSQKLKTCNFRTFWHSSSIKYSKKIWNSICQFVKSFWSSFKFLRSHFVNSNNNRPHAQNYQL